MLLRGTTTLNRSDLSAKLDELKTQLSMSAAGQTVTVRFDTLRKHLPEVLQLVRDALRNPAFAASEFDMVIKENLAQIDNQRNEPQGMGSQAVGKAMEVYRPGDVRAALSFDDLAARLKAAKLDDLKRFHAQFYGAYQRLVSLPRSAKPGETTLQAPDKANAFYLAALPLVLKDDMPDYVPLVLANAVLGGGVKSRLFDRLRQKEGISYGAGSALSASSFESVGMLKLYAIYAPQNLDKLKTGVREELRRFVQEGVTEQELLDAKKSLQEERKIARAQDPSLAAGLMGQLATGRTMAFTELMDARIEQTTLTEVNAALRKHIDPAQLLHVYAGDYAGAGKKAANPP